MVKAYPSITVDEFETAARTVETLYATLPQPCDWVEVVWSNNELRIMRGKPRSNQSKPLQSIQSKDDTEIGQEEIEESDEEFLIREQPEPSYVEVVNYSIVLSPTYQVPVLWFSSPSIPPTKADAIEMIYDHIVSPQSNAALRQIGVLGGISIAEHPVNSLPAFFIHPCRTPETLDMVQPDKDISPVEYLMLWFGIIASSVGLSIPSEIARLVTTLPNIS